MVVHALTRKDEDFVALICAISNIQPDWVVETTEEWKNYIYVWTLIQNLQKVS